MSLKPLYTSGQPHGRYPVDPSVTFQAGMVGQLTADAAGNPMVTLAGTKPLGLLEDEKTSTFTAAVIAEPHTVVTSGGSTVTLDHANVVAGSDLVFRLSSTGAATAVARTTDYTINNTNGVLTVVATGALDTATPYLDTDGDSVADSINITVNYQHAIPGVPGQDTTLGSGLATLHFQRGEFAVGVFDTSESYAVNDKLYVGDGTVAPTGVLTKDSGGNTQVVGVVTQRPTNSNPYLQLITDFDYGSWS